MRTAVLVILLLVLSPKASFAEQPLDIHALVNEAMSNSPELAALGYKADAARERIPQAGALPDPMFVAGFQNLPTRSLAFDREEMTQKMIELSQTIPYPGKRGLRSLAAGYEAQAVGQEKSEKALTLRAEVKAVYYELYAVKKSREIIARNIDLLDSARKTAEARYSVGTGTYRDILKAQLETAMLLDRRITLDREEATKRSYLGTLLGRTEPVYGDISDIVPTPVTDKREALVNAAISARPEILSIQARIKRAETSTAIARREYYPDFTISAQYMQRDNLTNGMRLSDMISMSVAINLPVWRDAKLAPAVREAGYERLMLEKELDTKTREIYSRIDTALSEIAQSDRLLRLYKDVTIPQADQDISAGIASYEAGKGDFISIIESRRVLTDYETGYYNALAAREKAVAELEAAVGKEF